MPEAWTTAFLIAWLAPVLLGVTATVHRLAPREALVPEWPVALAGLLAVVPTVAGALLLAAAVHALASPLAPAWGVLAGLLGGLSGVLVGWALADPARQRLRVPVFAGAVTVALIGLLVGPQVAGTAFEVVGLGGLLGVPLVVLGPAAAPAVAAWRGSGEARQRRLAPAAVGVLLAVLTVAGGGFALFEAASGSTPVPADHALEVAVEPDGSGAYEVRVPFPARSAPSPMLDRLAASTSVVEGEGTARVDGDELVVEAEGPVVVRAQHRFYGHQADRDAFLGWTLRDGNATRAEGGPANVTVRWSVSFHAAAQRGCLAEGAAGVRLAPGERAPLVPDRPGEGAPLVAACP